MKRILTWSVVVCFTIALMGCEAFKKKQPVEQAESEDKAALSTMTPETPAKTEVMEPAPETSVAPEQSVGGRTHVVQRGDTLFKLARQYYNGDIHQWRRIWEANRDKIPNKDCLRVGETLIIP